MDSILAVCQRSTQDFQLDDLLGVLVNYEVERELAQYIRANGREYPTRVRCGSSPTAHHPDSSIACTGRQQTAHHSIKSPPCQRNMRTTYSP